MKKSRQKPFRKPLAFLYILAYYIVAPFFCLKYHVRIDRSGIKNLKGPALVIAPHLCGKDPILLGMTLFPERPNFVVSEHFMAYAPLRPLLRMMHVITKKMYCPDVGTIMNILRAKKAGNVIVLFPEGRLPCYTHSVPVTEGTAELIQKLEIDVYTVTSNGAGLTFPKWRKFGRRGKIQVTTSHLFRAEEIKSLTLAEIQNRVDHAIAHDDELAMEGVSYACRDMTAGLDRILFRCPNCQCEDTLSAQNGHIRCTCGLDATLDHTYRLHNAPFTRVNEWYLWQQEQMNPDTLVLESKVTIGAINQKGNLISNAGSGIAHLDRNFFHLEGSVFDKPVNFTIPVARIGAFPISVGDHFDVYCNGELYHISTCPNPNDCIKWVTYLDRIQSLKHKTIFSNNTAN